MKKYSNDKWMLEQILIPENNKSLIDCIIINHGNFGNWEISADASLLSLTVKLTVKDYGIEESVTFDQLRIVNPERPLSFIWKMVSSLIRENRSKSMKRLKSISEKYSRISKFRKKWGIERSRFTINGMEFELNFDISREEPDKVLCWISTEEGLSAENVVSFLMSMGLIPKTTEDVKVKWNA